MNEISEEKQGNKFGMLSDKEIEKRLKKDLIVYPYLLREIEVKEAKVDIRLGGTFYEIQQRGIGAYDTIEEPPPDYLREIVLPPGEPYILHPHVLVLAQTYENISLPNDLVGLLQGRSSLGRLGVIIHATAGFIDPGYKGIITLELSNLGHLPVKLYPLQRVATIGFIDIKGKVGTPYGKKLGHLPLEQIKGKYSSMKTEASKIDKDWENEILKIMRDDLKN